MNGIRTNSMPPRTGHLLTLGTAREPARRSTETAAEGPCFWNSNVQSLRDLARQTAPVCHETPGRGRGFGRSFENFRISLHPGPHASLPEREQGTLPDEQNQRELDPLVDSWRLVNSETTISVRNPNGMVTIPGWLNGTSRGASCGFIP